MLDSISKGFKQAKSMLTGVATLDEATLKPAIEEIRKSLLEADVEYSVVKKFVRAVRDKSLGSEVRLAAGKKSEKIKVTPQDHFINTCKSELEALLGDEETAKIEFVSNRPTIILMVGLQGTGKTTTTGKITKLFKEEKKRKPLMVAADIYRPAAVDQLKVLGDRIGVEVFHQENTPVDQICKNAVKYAFDNGFDTVLFDTAGRLTIDSDLMNELKLVKETTNPDHVLLVVDAMMGQDAVTTADAFNQQLELDGFVMTKLDGDARGGAALSIREVTGKPIKFLGTGEDLKAIETFRPEGLASRILGFGDVVGLMQDFEKVADKDHEEDAMKMLQGDFSFKDFYKQISMIQKMGSLKDVAAKLPMQNMLPDNAEFDDKELVKIKSIIDSMTEQERIKPAVLNNSRVKRISKGAGRTEKDVFQLIEKFKGMRKMMGMMGKGFLSKIPGLGQLSQLGQMKKMAQSMGGGGMAGLADMFGGMGGMGGAPQKSAKKPVDRDRLKKARKAAKKARKKNRKK